MQYSTLNDYLLQCCKIVFKNENQGLPRTYMRLHVAHFMKYAIKWKSLQGKIKRNCQFYISIVAQAVQVDSLITLKQIFMPQW